jgi:hypothetical protein
VSMGLSNPFASIGGSMRIFGRAAWLAMSDDRVLRAAAARPTVA